MVYITFEWFGGDLHLINIYISLNEQSTNMSTVYEKDQEIKGGKDLLPKN